MLNSRSLTLLSLKHNNRISGVAAAAIAKYTTLKTKGYNIWQTTIYDVSSLTFSSSVIYSTVLFSRVITASDQYCDTDMLRL
ncbi:hypothetical protein EB796_006314 [Bugula neritina]|uniref:Uncharacterized protein n=1 Tax=Bugula neritina TaxID=10212 RepID=A0A7J7KCW4_BUGNE|nr:hypothetical protein EB796_006314 [Bugula neritina]